jgi:small conductance mechanosensitive channel
MSAIAVAVLSAAAIVVAAWFVGGWAAGLFGAVLSRTRIDPLVRSYLTRLTQPVVLALAGVAALAQLGVDIRVLLALLAAAALALGLGLQATVAHLTAGAILLSRRPFNVGDTVEIAGITGTVREIGVYAVTLQEADGTLTSLTNGLVTGAPIRNKSRAEDVETSA